MKYNYTSFYLGQDDNKMISAILVEMVSKTGKPYSKSKVIRELIRERFNKIKEGK